MKFIELQEAFELELNKFDDIDKIPSTDIEYWLNQGLMRFIKTRYSGMNSKHEGVEQSQKRVDDLRKLLLSVTYSGTNLIYTQYAIVTGDYSVYSGANQIIVTLQSGDAVNKINNGLYTVTLPDNYFLKLGENTGIVPTDGITIPCWQQKDGQYITKYVTPIHETTLTIGQRLENSLSQHNLHNATAKPLSIQIDNKICFYTDGQYKVRDVTVHYIKYPSKINIHTTPFDEYTEMPKHTHMEIVKMAVLMYMENKGDQRYQSYLAEIDMME